eukprot:5965438-Lingulodinium_polyedra.AAC.1
MGNRNNRACINAAWASIGRCCDEYDNTTLSYPLGAACANGQAGIERGPIGKYRGRRRDTTRRSQRAKPSGGPNHPAATRRR